MAWSWAETYQRPQRNKNARNFGIWDTAMLCASIMLYQWAYPNIRARILGVAACTCWPPGASNWLSITARIGRGERGAPLLKWLMKSSSFLTSKVIMQEFTLEHYAGVPVVVNEASVMVVALLNTPNVIAPRCSLAETAVGHASSGSPPHRTVLWTMSNYIPSITTVAKVCCFRVMLWFCDAELLSRVPLLLLWALERWVCYLGRPTKVRIYSDWCPHFI